MMVESSRQPDRLHTCGCKAQSASTLSLGVGCRQPGWQEEGTPSRPSGSWQMPRQASIHKSEDREGYQGTL